MSLVATASVSTASDKYLPPEAQKTDLPRRKRKKLDFNK